MNFTARNQGHIKGLQSAVRQLHGVDKLDLAKHADALAKAAGELIDLMMEARKAANDVRA